MPPRRLSASYRLAIALVRPPLRLAARREWRGGERLPTTGGFIACSNHLSHLDPFTLADFLVAHGCPPRFLAKEAVFRVPIGGRIVAGAGQIPVRRETEDAGRALQGAAAAVEAGECVAIYPEATLTRDPGSWPMTGKTGAARLALTTGCPVIPVAQWGVQELLAPYSRRLRPVPRRLLHVWAGPPVDLSAFVDLPLDAEVLRAATEAILDPITRMLEQIRGESAPPHRWNPRIDGAGDDRGGAT